MIQLNNLKLSFGSQKIFDGVCATLQDGDRIGLVGKNGTGKTTLLKVIAGTSQLDSGSVTVIGGARVAYLPQELVLNSTDSIFEEAMAAFYQVGILRRQKVELEPLVHAGDNQAVIEYAHVIEQLSQFDVGAAERKTREMLIGLGFKEVQLNDSVTTLSVGWQMRVVLAKLLLQNADFYLFDEPTNHLDIVAKDWFLQFLQSSDFGFLLVSHDKYFLDQLCTKIIELDRGKATVYYGNYQEYVEQKEHDLNLLRASAEQQQKELKKKQDWVDKFKAKASKAKLAKSVAKSLEKVERIELPPDPKSVHFHFAQVQRSGKIVLEVVDLAFAYDNKQIFKQVNFSIERGQKVALVARNGVGKTTLFNVLCGKYKPQTGSVQLGHNVVPAVFEQEQHKVLNPNKTILQEVLDSTAHKTEQQIRTFLGSFLFSADAVSKKTKVLSGGERNRVSMVKVLLQDANFLLLDEPTNHLDIESKEILFRALNQYDGTVFFVSHDHDFVNKLATRVIELTPDGVYSYEGNYDSYLQQKAEVISFNSNQKDLEIIEKKESKKVDKKQIVQLEREIAKLEAEIAKISNSFADLEYGTSAFEQAQKKLTEKEQLLQEVTAQWESLQE